MRIFINLQELINLDTIRKLTKVESFLIAMLKIFWDRKHNKTFQPGGLTSVSETINLNHLKTKINCHHRNSKLDLLLLKMINFTHRGFQRNLPELN